jgi:hypothetical protein
VKSSRWPVKMLKNTVLSPPFSIFGRSTCDVVPET